LNYICFLLPDLSTFNTSSVDQTTSCARDAFTSLQSSYAISNTLATFLLNSSYFMSFNLSDMAFTTTEDQSIHDSLDIRSFNFLGTLTTNSTILITLDNRDHPLYKKFFRKRLLIKRRKHGAGT
jgi:hypothetical protein